MINKYSRNDASNVNGKYDISSMHMWLTCLCTLAIKLSLFALYHNINRCVVDMPTLTSLKNLEFIAGAKRRDT